MPNVGRVLMVVVCLLALIACQENPPNDDNDGPSSKSSPREVLHEINALLSEGLTLATELRTAATNGDPLDKAKLERIREIAEEAVALKLRFMGLLPEVGGGLPFKHFYQQLRFLDGLIEFAASLAIGIEEGSGSEHARDELKRILQTLEREKEWLMSHWPDQDLPRFQEMDDIIDAVQRRLQDPDDNLEEVYEELIRLGMLKPIAAAELPDRVYGQDLGFWYDSLFKLDGYIELSVSGAERVEWQFNEFNTDLLIDFLTQAEFWKFQILNHVTD
jgi:hypothetical protein